MQQVQPGHEVLSLFGIANKNQALGKKIASNGLLVSLISAFFIILAVSLILGVATKILGPTSSSLAVNSIQEEIVAFEPGQSVSQEISRGYLGNYR